MARKNGLDRAARTSGEIDNVRFNLANARSAVDQRYRLRCEVTESARS